VKIFLTAARKKRVPREQLDRVREAMRAYERLIDTHAGDRATLEMMLTSCAQRGRERVDQEHRRAAFRANSYIWGIQAKTQFRTYFLVPSEQEGLFDVASLRGYVGLRRIRAGVPWAIHRATVVDDDGVQRRAMQSEWLDSPDDPNETCGVPLLREFCTKPLPKMRRVTVRPGLVDHEIIEGQVGNTAMGTCVMGEIVRGTGPRWGEEHNECVELATRVNTPCEHLVFDQIIHADLFGAVEPQLTVYSELAGVTPARQEAASRLPLPVLEGITHLGRAAGPLHVAETPRYADMTNFVFEKLGLDRRAFDVYRVHMAFPPIPTAVVVSMTLSPQR
jgi:hypothetical protein